MVRLSELGTTRSSRPSPSKSPEATFSWLPPATKSTWGWKESGFKGPIPENRTLKGCFDQPVSPLTVTLTGEYSAPAGTRTARLVLVADVTCARTLPKYTVLPPGTELKFAPWRTTASPPFAFAGKMLLTRG